MSFENMDALDRLSNAELGYCMDAWLSEFSFLSDGYNDDDDDEIMFGYQKKCAAEEETVGREYLGTVNAGACDSSLEYFGQGESDATVDSHSHSTVEQPPVSLNASEANAPLNIYVYARLLLPRETLEFFCRAIDDEQTVIFPEWPSQVPTDRLFFGDTDIGVVDFGGIKSGTPYEIPGTTEGLLVNYSGEKSGKLSGLYPNESNIKVMKLRLYTTTPPPIDYRDCWTECVIRGQLSVYLYNKMALYVFGGELYLPNSGGHFHTTTSGNDAARPDSLIFLGPSAKSRKLAAKRKTSDGTKKIKGVKQGRTSVFDP